MEGFQVAAGSTIGKDHLLAIKNNQDAFSVIETPERVVVVVADGCGSGAHSEVGAKLFAQHMATFAAMEKVWDYDDGHHLAKFYNTCLKSELREAFHILGPSVVNGKLNNAKTVEDYLLFTLLIGIITPKQTVVLSCGDGYYGYNGNLVELTSSDGNRPDYPGYVLAQTASNRGEAVFSLKVQLDVPTEEVQSLLLATDGLRDVVKNEGAFLPGRTDRKVEPTSYFWTHEGFFSNSDGLRRYLYLMSKSITSPDWENRTFKNSPSLLTDDTTVAVVRRKPNDK